MTIGELLRAPGRAGWVVLALVAYLNHLYLCGVPVGWTTWLISLALSMLMAVTSGAVYTAFAFRRSRRQNRAA